MSEVAIRTMQCSCGCGVDFYSGKGAAEAVLYPCQQHEGGELDNYLLNKLSELEVTYIEEDEMDPYERERELHWPIANLDD